MVEHRKPPSEKHWKRLHNIRTHLQKHLEITTTATDTSLREILDKTAVTIILSKLLQISPELRTYIQHAALEEIMGHLKDIEVNATTLNPDASVIHLRLGNHKLSNVLVDGGSGVNVKNNHLPK